ncbi:MAG: GNAT family N-acetyltransferase, partial [Chloroflexi bacterium]|nr:GNAT family N-acetyltransferase [Chloroflexota bacterium]
DIGYWLGEPVWNKGYMTDAIRLVCHFSFKYLDAARVSATVFVGNIGSRRALEKNDFSLDGTMRCHVYKRSKWLDVWFFTLLLTEWDVKHEEFCPQYEEVIVASERE